MKINSSIQTTFGTWSSWRFIWWFPKIGGTPSHHPFLDGSFHDINHPAIRVPPFLSHHFPIWNTIEIPLNPYWNTINIPMKAPYVCLSCPKPTVAVVSLVCRACSSTPWTERSWISRPRARCETRGVPRVGRRENRAKIYRWPRVNMQQKTWKILEKHMFFSWVNGNVLMAIFNRNPLVSQRVVV